MRTKHTRDRKVRNKPSRLLTAALFAGVLPLFSCAVGCGKKGPSVKKEKVEQVKKAEPAPTKTPTKTATKTSSVCNSRNRNRVQYDNRGPCPKDCLPLVKMVEPLTTKTVVRVGHSVGPIILHVRNGGRYSGKTVDKFRVKSIDENGVELGECSDYGFVQGTVLRINYGETKVVKSVDFSHNVAMVITVAKGRLKDTAIVESGPVK